MDLDAIEAAEKAMTAAPWKVVPSNEKANSCRIFGDKYIGVFGGSDDPKNEVEANATGIALLRNSTPEMVARIREQDTEIERLERLLELERGERREKDIAAACDHLHETIHRLRALCGESAKQIDGAAEYVFHDGETDASDKLNELANRLRAALNG